MHRTVGHAWLPGFYFAAEIKANKSLSKETAFIVIKGQKVLDISPGAGGKGIKPGMTLRQARIICPRLVEIEYVPERYSGFADEVWEMCASYCPAVEPLDQNEAFIELPKGSNVFDTLDKISRHAESIVGVSPLYGIARCKLIARIISGVLSKLKIKHIRRFPENMAFHGGKHIGIDIVMEKEKEFLQPLPVNALWPLDSEILSRLHGLGIGCIGEIQRMEKAVLIDMFGELGHVIHQYSLGIDYSGVLRVFPRNHLVFSKSFDLPISDKLVLLESVTECVSCLEKRLYEIYMTTKEVEIVLECDGGSIVNCRKHLAKQVSAYGGLLRICKRLLQEAFDDGKVNRPVKAISVKACNLVPVKTGSETDMFASYKARVSTEVIDRVLCKAREMFGSGVVFPGREFQLDRRDKLLLVSEDYVHEESQRINSCHNTGLSTSKGVLLERELASCGICHR